MCGLFGAVIYNKEHSADTLTARIAKAQEVQAHRGPDMHDYQVFEFENVTVMLAHQRLSILDLSENGRQPMRSSAGDHVIAFNGEVYNYKELSERYNLSMLQSSTDTEVILEVLSERKYGEALSEFNGMWAIATLDLKSKSLMLSRDRAGVKPLYYTVVHDNLYFASEIKTLLALTDEKFELNLGVVGRYLEQSLQDDSCETFFEGIKSFPAGEYCVLNLAQNEIDIVGKPYWSALADAGKHDYSNPVAQFKTLFSDSVKLRLRADVPVGVTLSGGLDSSLICHEVRQQLGHSDFLVLSAVSPGNVGDESDFIDLVASHYGLSVNKVDLRWSPEETMELMHKTTRQNDTPLGSLSNVAFYLLMSKARDLGVKVILSGQGADEILCGYKKYLGFYLKHLLRDRRYIEAMKVISQFAFKGTVLSQFSWAEAKRYIERPVANKDSILSERVLRDYVKAPLAGIGESMSHRQWLDYAKYSVPYLTHYEDRMSMAFAREIRLPFLDYRLVSYMLNAPVHLKLAKGWTKYLLRVAYESLLPKPIVWRKDKQGFTNPQDAWLKHELKPAVLSYFAPSALIFKYDLVQRDRLLEKYEHYCNGTGKVWYREIFNPLGLEVWLREFESSIKEK